MPLTPTQQAVCKLIAEDRRTHQESYVAGGAALNVLAGGNRFSDDIDLFHDTEEALKKTWISDRQLFVSKGFQVEVEREEKWFIRATVGDEHGTATIDWARDSAYRFFPLVEHEILGLVLHPFDLATNKTLATVGRLEVRDWIDLITCHEKIQRLGYLAWAACGKDPGFCPRSILTHAGRSNRFTQLEVDGERFEGATPDAGELSRRWHAARNEAFELVDLLPYAEAGKCVTDSRGALFSGNGEELRAALAAKELRYHSGSIRGALPRIVE